MNKQNMLYIKCKYCGTIIPTGISVDRTSKGNILEKNTIGPCPNPKCRKMNTWDGKDAFFEDGVPFISK